jgi:hypothetical protein
MSPLLACLGCDQPLAEDLRCQTCGYSYCPFCRRGHWEACEHLLTAVQYQVDDGWIEPPFEAYELPRLPAELRLADYSEVQKSEAFGHLTPLLAAWAYDESDQREYVDQYRLFDLLLTRLSVPVEPNSSFPDQAQAHVGEYGYFTQRKDEARAEISTLLGRLSKGFHRLADMEPDR